jgi:phosphatidylserine/phosphatidylglycerophosphate/cardiolipin synthase-like enzyme
VSLALTVLLFLPAARLPADVQNASTVRLLKDRQFFHALTDHIAGATCEIVVSMFLFKTKSGSSNRAEMILEDLIAAQKRGIDVRVLLEKTDRKGDSVNRENLATSRRLRQHGIDVRFDSLDRTTHTKVIVIDRRYVFMGSHNLTHSALYYNHELSVLIDDPALAEDVLRYLRELET